MDRFVTRTARPRNAAARAEDDVDEPLRARDGGGGDDDDDDEIRRRRERKEEGAEMRATEGGASTSKHTRTLASVNRHWRAAYSRARVHHHEISSFGTRRLNTELLPQKMHLMGRLEPECRPRTIAERSDSTLQMRFRTESIGVDIVIDDAGQLAVEACDGREGRLVVHRIEDVRHAIESELRGIGEEHDAKRQRTDAMLPEGGDEYGDENVGVNERYEPMRLKKREVLSINARRDHTACVWNPANQDVIASVGAQDNDVYIYDLRYCGDRPTEKLLSINSSSRSNFLSNVRPGLSALQYLDASGKVILASSEAFGVAVFDSRERTHLVGTLSDPQLERGCRADLKYYNNLHSVAVHPDGRSVVSGTQGGRILIWDIRNGFDSRHGRGAASAAFAVASNEPSKRNRARTVLNPAKMMRVPGIPDSPVQATLFDPQDPRRLGVHMGSGCSAIIDLSRKEMTHLHSPPSWMDDMSGQGVGVPGYWRVRRRRCCWAGGGSLFCVPSRKELEDVGPCVYVLDFSSSIWSHCHVDKPSTYDKYESSELRPQGAFHCFRCRRWYFPLFYLPPSPLFASTRCHFDECCLCVCVVMCSSSWAFLADDDIEV